MLYLFYLRQGIPGREGTEMHQFILSHLRLNRECTASWNQEHQLVVLVVGFVIKSSLQALK